MLYVFVEGPDDEAYFRETFSRFWDVYKIIRYADMKNEKINNFIKSINCIPDSDYMFFGDSDGMEINDKRQLLMSQFSNLSAEKTIIVQYEIESWYYAGIDEFTYKKLKMKHYVFKTDSLTKEQFYSKLARPSDRKYVMAKILTEYSLDLAITRNNSLNLFGSSYI